MKAIIIIAALVILTVAGCSHYGTTLDETKYQCEYWYKQATSEEAYIMAGQDIKSNPQKYYDNMAEALNLKLKDCGYKPEFAEDPLSSTYYGCSICYNWTTIPEDFDCVKCEPPLPERVEIRENISDNASVSQNIPAHIQLTVLLDVGWEGRLIDKIVWEEVTLTFETADEKFQKTMSPSDALHLITDSCREGEVIGGGSMEGFKSVLDILLNTRYYGTSHERCQTVQRVFVPEYEGDKIKIIREQTIIDNTQCKPSLLIVEFQCNIPTEMEK